MLANEVMLCGRNVKIKCDIADIIDMNALCITVNSMQDTMDEIAIPHDLADAHREFDLACTKFVTALNEWAENNLEEVAEK